VLLTGRTVARPRDMIEGYVLVKASYPYRANGRTNLTKLAARSSQSRPKLVILSRTNKLHSRPCGRFWRRRSSRWRSVSIICAAF